MKFKSDIEVQAGLRDGSNDIGTAGQLLSSTGTITNWINQSDVVAAGATRVLIACKNTSGGTIAKGTPVYQTGNVGATDVIEVAEADALISTGYLPAIGLLETDLINNAFGHVVITGELLNITTSPIDGVVPVTGDTIYLKSGGGLTLTKPTGEGNAIQNLGLVGKVSGGNAGSLTVASIMRQNDVPNLPEGRIWIGDGNTIVSDTVYVDEPNNRVGIGTTTPSTDLEVSSTGVNGVDISQSASNASQSGRLFFTTNTASEGFALFNSNGTFQVNSGGIPNNTSGTNRISIIGSSGNVGIGTTSPGTYRLAVAGTFRSNGWSYFSTDGPTSIAQLGGGTTTTSQFNIISTAGGGSFISATNKLSLKANNTTAIHIDNTGNVGIGTTSPGSKLTVDGSTRLGGDVEVSELLSGDKVLTLTANGGSFAIGDIDGLGDQAFISGDSSSIEISINQSTSLYCDVNNRVGIGTTSPSEKLHVDGNARLTGLFYDGTNSGGTNGQILSSDGGQTEWIDGSAIPGVPAGSGSTNYLARWTPDASTLGVGVTYDNGTNVGIGTSSPLVKLDVYGGLHLGTTGDFYITQSSFSTTQFYVTGGGNGGTIAFGAPASNTQNVSVQGDLYSYQGSIGTKQFGVQNNKISYNGDNYLNSGNLGIGTTSPDAKLEVSSLSGGVLRLTSSDTSVATGESIGRVEFKSNDASTGGNNVMGFVDCLATNAGSTYALTFGTGNAAAATEKMRINQAGNVGIGTTNPNAKLEVAGSTRITGSGLDVGYGNNGTNYVQVGFGRTTNGFALIDLIGDSTYTDYGFRIIRNNTGANTNSEIIHRGTGALNLNATQAGSITLKTSNVERVRVNSSGNVGIGTTNPNRLLTVETTGSGCYLALNSSSNNTTIGSDVNGAFVVYDDSSATYRMVIDQTTGNIGVNTTNPYAKLHVASANGSDVPTAGTATGGLFVSNTNKTYGINMGVSGSGWSFIQSQRADGLANLYSLNLQPLGGNVGIGVTSPQSKLQVNGGVQLAFDGSTPSLAKVGTFRYRKSGNNTYVDMCMQTGASTYAWVNIVTNSW